MLSGKFTDPGWMEDNHGLIIMKVQGTKYELLATFIDIDVLYQYYSCVSAVPQGKSKIHLILKLKVQNLKTC